jgi:SSS family solute:Na+ symporter
MIFGLILAVLGLILFEPYQYLGIESIFMLATLFIMLGIILFTNTRMKSSDKKAFEINPELFNTATPFNLGAAGIVLIVGMLYYFFWM